MALHFSIGIHIRSGKIGEREVYIYREGFYRGSAVAFTLLAAATLLLAFRLYVSWWISANPDSWRSWRIPLMISSPLGLIGGGLCMAFCAKWGWLRWIGLAALGVGVLSEPTLLSLFVSTQSGVVRGWDNYREILWFVFFTSLACSWLSYARYRRFGMYRVTNALIGFVTIKDDKKEDKKGESSVTEPKP
jgi:hypothetical protein